MPICGISWLAKGDDVRAAEAIALFCYQVKKCVESCAAALGGLDTPVFAGGIGENAPVIHARICEVSGASVSNSTTAGTNGASR